MKKTLLFSLLGLILLFSGCGKEGYQEDYLARTSWKGSPGTLEFLGNGKVVFLGVWENINGTYRIIDEANISLDLAIPATYFVPISGLPDYHFTKAEVTLTQMIVTATYDLLGEKKEETFRFTKQ